VICNDVLHYLPAPTLRLGMHALAKRLRGVAYLGLFTSADDIEGDLHGYLRRSPSFYRSAFEDAGLRGVTYVIDACADGLLVMSDSYFPGWHARIDGVETPVWRADYAFRAVEVAKGPHWVELRYWPASFTIGLVISLLSLLALAAPWGRRVVRTRAVRVD
jgi:hypothetical protein